MAPLPRYQELGVRPAAGNAISPVGLEAGARESAALGENISRLTSFAFSQMEQIAKAEGLEYGVANAPTPEQLRRAQESGEPLNIGDNATVFGRAQRAGSLFAIEKNVEVEARQKLAELAVSAKTQMLSAAQYQKAAQDIVDGYGASVAGVSPQTAATVRASLSTVASSQFVTYSNWLLEKQIARDKIVTVAGIDTVIKNARSIVEAGDTVYGPEGGDQLVVSTDQKLTGERNKILRFALSVNDPELAKTKLKEFNEEVSKARVGTIARWTQGPDGVPTMEKYNSVMRGDVSDPTVAGMWGRMTGEERAKAQDEVRRQMKAQLELDSSLDAQRERDRREAQRVTRGDFVKAWSTGDAGGQQAALKKMQDAGDAEGFEKYSKLTGETVTVTEPGLIFYMEQEVVRGNVSQERIASLVAERRMSHKDAMALIPKIETAANRDMQEALQTVKNALGYPDRQIINPGAADRKAMQEVAEIQNEMIAAKQAADREGKSFNAFDFAKKAITDRRNRGPSPDDILAAENMLKGLRTILKVPETASLADLKQALAAATTKKPNQPGYFNPNQAPAYQSAIDLLLKNGSK